MQATDVGNRGQSTSRPGAEGSEMLAGAARTSARNTSASRAKRARSAADSEVPRRDGGVPDVLQPPDLARRESKEGVQR